MRKRLIFLAGVGVGYVLGTRAGRERFDQMVAQTRRMWESPTVQEAAGLFQAQANRLYDQGKHVVGDQFHKVSGRAGKLRRDQSGGLDGFAGTSSGRDYPTSGSQTTNAEKEEAWDLSERRRNFHANAF